MKPSTRTILAMSIATLAVLGGYTIAGWFFLIVFPSASILMISPKKKVKTESLGKPLWSLTANQGVLAVALVLLLAFVLLMGFTDVFRGSGTTPQGTFTLNWAIGLWLMSMAPMLWVYRRRRAFERI